MGRSRQSAWLASAASIAAVAPTSSTSTSRCRAAETAPSTIGAGAWSPPIASTAMRMVAVALFLADRTNLPLVVVAAVRADPVRCLGLVALRAQIGGRGGQGVVRAAL